MACPTPRPTRTTFNSGDSCSRVTPGPSSEKVTVLRQSGHTAMLCLRHLVVAQSVRRQGPRPGLQHLDEPAWISSTSGKDRCDLLPGQALDGCPSQDRWPASLSTRYLIPLFSDCLLYTSPSPRDRQKSRMPSSA